MTDTTNPVAAAVSEAVYRQGIAPEHADDFADDLIEWLAVNGHAVVKLPEMARNEFGDPTWPFGDSKYSHVRADDDGRISVLGSSNPIVTPDEAASEGAALIAAAKYLEEKR